jgi:hypothetical protein
MHRICSNASFVAEVPDSAVVVLDRFSREVAGQSVGDALDAELAGRDPLARPCEEASMGFASREAVERKNCVGHHAGNVDPM